MKSLGLEGKPLLSESASLDDDALFERFDAFYVFVLAQSMINGEYVPMDVKRGVSLVARLASAEIPDRKVRQQVMYTHAMLLRRGESGHARDPERAFEIMTQLHNEGLVFATHVLASMLTLGDGCPADPQTAIRYHERAASSGVVRSLTMVGDMYAEGTGVPQDDAKAEYFYSRAAQSGDPIAMFNMSVRLQRQGKEEEAAKYLVRAARDHGIPQAKFNLAKAHASGRGVEQSLEEAYSLMASCAMAGFTPAIPHVAAMSLLGQGTAPDTEAAIYWGQVAVQLGNPAMAEFVKHAVELGRQEGIAVDAVLKRGTVPSLESDFAEARAKRRGGEVPPAEGGEQVDQPRVSA